MKYDVMIGALQDTIAALGKIAEELSNVMPEESKKAEKKPKHSFEEVRGVLAKLSADGYTTEVKAILTKFECRKLSDVKEDDYEKVLQEAKKICHR